MANNNKKKSGNKTNADLTKASSYKSSAKQNSKQQKSKQGKKKGGIMAFFRGVKQELKKVVWPTREELTTDTIVVIACVAFFALAFWLIDTGFLAALKGILGITLS